MIIWRGWGILVFIFVMSALVASEWLSRVYLAPDYAKQHHWPMAAALAAAGVASWIVGCIVNRDDGNGGYGHLHHLYFISMQWWGGLLLLAGAAIFLVGIANPDNADAANPAPQDPMTMTKRR
jgi:hypothetical protein